MPIMTLVGSPTSIGSYTFVVRAKAYENHTNSKGESTVDVTFTYVVSNDNTLSTSTTTSSSTTTTTPTPTTYKPIIRFVPSALSFNVDPSSVPEIDVRSDITYQIEVIGMKPNGYFYFNLGDFLGNPGYRWNTGPMFSARGIDPSNIQADKNGHWSMNITIPAGAKVDPEGYMRIADFGSKDPNVIIIPNDVFMYVTR